MTASEEGQVVGRRVDRRVATLGVLICLSGAACTGASHHSGDSSPSPTASATSASSALTGPRWFAVLGRGHVQWYSSRTGKPIGMSGGPKGLRVVQIGSWHDDRSVVLAARGRRLGPCRTLLQRQRVDRDNQLTETDLPHLRTVEGLVDSLAVSPDRSRIALGLHVGDENGGGCDRPELLVVDLNTGARRVWTLPYTETAAGGGGYGDSAVIDPAWGPDNRRLALRYAQCCVITPDIWTLDTHKSSGRLLPRLHKLTERPFCAGIAYAWTQRGLVTDNTACSGEGNLAVLDPATGALRGLGTSMPDAADEISPDVTGTHYLVFAGQHLYRIDGRAVTKLLYLSWHSGSRQAVW